MQRAPSVVLATEGAAARLQAEMEFEVDTLQTSADGGH
jgi:hypothetical protein